MRHLSGELQLPPVCICGNLTPYLSRTTFLLLLLPSSSSHPFLIILLKFRAILVIITFFPDARIDTKGESEAREWNSQSVRLFSFICQRRVYSMSFLCEFFFELSSHFWIPTFRRIYDFYHPIHAYLSIFLCVLGTIANFCNIVVLTRRTMRTPVNMILTAMASCDTVVLFSNLIYTTHYSFVAFKFCHPKHWSYSWALFLIAHAHLSLVAHSSSVWLSGGCFRADLGKYRLSQIKQGRAELS